MRPVLPSLLSVALVLSGCGGGGGGGTPPAALVTIALPSTASLDGYVYSLGHVVDTGDAIVVGDWPNAMGWQGLRGFVSFDLTGIPAGSQVTSARLALTQFAMDGTPFTTLGVVIVDQVVYGDQLSAGAYDLSHPSFQAFTVLSSDYLAGPKTTSVTDAVQAAVDAGDPRAQFRLRFAVADDFDMSVDVALFHSAESAPTAAEVPTLLVTYLP